jgi:hypothetical protein
MLSVPDRRRSRRLQSAIRARDVRAADLQEEPTKPVEDRAVLVDGRFVGSDEDGGSPANIERAERAIGHSERQRAEQSNLRIARRCAEPGWRAAVLDERASSQPCKQSGFRIGCWLGASEEGSGNKRRPRRAERAIYT